MLRHLGYVAIALSIDATTNRTCRLRNATPERLRELIRSNLQDLHRVFEFNIQHGVFFYRISSQIIPFASHPVNGILWWEEFAGLFAQLAEFIHAHGLRVSMHPGQFTVLNSPNPHVVDASIRELQWHTRFLESLRTDASHKIVIHVGGIYGNKAQGTDRFVAVANSLPESCRQRLVVENDERSFAVQDVLDISRHTGLPVVLDWLHHKTNPGPVHEASDLISRCFATWDERDGLPKLHFSSQAKGGRSGEHADWLNVSEFEEFLRLAPNRDFDCMLEAKRKDLALFRLRSELKAHGI